MKIRLDAAPFWRHVDIGRRSECWNWTGAVNTTGYGAASWSGRMYVAHRNNLRRNGGNAMMRRAKSADDVYGDFR